MIIALSPILTLKRLLPRSINSISSHFFPQEPIGPSDELGMKNTLKRIVIGTFTFAALFSSQGLKADNDRPLLRKVQPDSEALDSLVPKMGTNANGQKTDVSVSRRLASGNNAEDLDHYSKLERRLGVDVGLMVPFGDFQKSFSNATMVGLHFTWEAIAPFALRVSTQRASSYHKSGAASGKLSVSSINVGTQASFPVNRFVPFLKFEGSFNFNDVSFDASKVVTAGSDTFVTTVGLNVGIGIDFIVGREVSFGFEGTYHYLVPKKINLSDNTMFDLGSSYATAGFRFNF